MSIACRGISQSASKHSSPRGSVLGLILAVVFGAYGWAGAAAADGEVDSARERPRVYLTGLAGGAWATADIEGSTTADGDFGGSSHDQTAFGGAALGTTLDLGWSDLRLELEGVGGRRFTFDTPSASGTWVTHAENWTLQGNFWFEYALERLLPETPVLRNVAPFTGGGLGLSRTTLTATGPGASGRSESSTLAWQAGAGLAYRVAPWLVLDVRYQYADLGGPSVELRAGGVRQGQLDLDIGTHEVVGGVRFVLPSF